ncbi:hypothetical protein K488DRAFT_77756 [Vararia minispora EC-137]|uniref:Uncharacterized protein n=1 Tax=Vararia minispora EC-137 TaxID=1314806 RepID=A0ACB8QQQ3_9AGAM|nr:hypothetical protein K488DRAFT_77756 [Vararia minispora EC-137]
MLPTWMSTIASVGMAIGPSLVYADQTYSIIRKKNATGFSKDVCAVMLFSNIMRCFFWLGNQFELALLFQSIFLILTHLAVLYVCILYKPAHSTVDTSSSRRPFSFWQWQTYPQYIECIASYIITTTVLFLIFSRFPVFIDILGYLALGLESSLPVPQLVSNFKLNTLYGFRASTLMGWFGGDTYKLVYFFVNNAPLQFKLGAIFQLTVDSAIVIQRFVYGNAPPLSVLGDEEVPLALEEDG